MTPPVVVLAGGLGTRLRDITHDRCPKPMVPVRRAGAIAPFLELVLAHLRRQGCLDVAICIGHLGESIRRHFADGRRFGLRIVYDDIGAASTGARVLSAAARFESAEFLIVCGDTYHPLDVGAFLDDFRRQPALLAQLALVEPTDDLAANVAINHDGLVCAYGDEPSGERTGTEAGTLVVRRQALDAWALQPSLSLTGDIYPALIARRSIAGRFSTAPFFDIGTPFGYRRFSEFAAGGGV